MLPRGNDNRDITEHDVHRSLTNAVTNQKGGIEALTGRMIPPGSARFPLAGRARQYSQGCSGSCQISTRSGAMQGTAGRRADASRPISAGRPGVRIRIPALPSATRNSRAFAVVPHTAWAVQRVAIGTGHEFAFDEFPVARDLRDEAVGVAGGKWTLASEGRTPTEQEGLASRHSRGFGVAVVV